MKIDLQNYYKNTLECYKFLCFNFSKHFFLLGSRKSGKSWFAIDFIYFCMIYFPCVKIMIFRHLANKIRTTTFQNFKDAVDRLKLAPLVKINNENKIEFWNGSTIKYMGMKDNHIAVKDLHINIAIYEEAEQSKRREYTAIKTNLREGQTGLIRSLDKKFIFQNKLIFCLNPPEYADHYIPLMFENQNDYEDTIFLKTTIDDNKHATEQDYKDLEEIKYFDEYDYLRYRYGLIVPRADGLFFKQDQHFYFISQAEYEEKTHITEAENKKLLKLAKAEKEELNKIRKKKRELNVKDIVKVYGLDFSSGKGRDPLTLLEIYINFTDRTIFVKDIIFDNTLDEIEEIHSEMELRKVSTSNYIFADNQEALVIKALRKRSWRIYEAPKPRILESIKVLKTFKIYFNVSEKFTPKNTRIKQIDRQEAPIKQIPKYSRKYDMRREIFINEPETDAKNMGIDIWDSLRYGVIGYMEQFNKK